MRQVQGATLTALVSLHNLRRIACHAPLDRMSRYSLPGRESTWGESLARSEVRQDAVKCTVVLEQPGLTAIGPLGAIAP